jgi:hypothetical protein
MKAIENESDKELAIIEKKFFHLTVYELLGRAWLSAATLHSQIIYLIFPYANLVVAPRQSSVGAFV